MSRARKLVLHVGHGKTGTTSLQHALLAAHDGLKECGVFFPKVPPYSGNSTVLLEHLLGAKPHSKKFLKQLNEGRWLGESSSRMIWNNLVSQIKVSGCDTVLISSEHFFHDIMESNLRVLDSRAKEFAEEVEIVAYLRSPGPYFLSLLQQSLKVVRENPAIGATPRKRRLRYALEEWNGKVSLGVFDKSLLKGGDLIEDFQSRYIPQVSEGVIKPMPNRSNASMSAEAMALAMDLRAGRLNQKNYNDPFLRALQRADKELPSPTKPILFEDKADAVQNWFAPETFWLRGNHGIVYPDVNYGALRESTNSSIVRTDKVEDICTVDPARKEALFAKTINRIRLSRLKRKIYFWTQFKVE